MNARYSILATAFLAGIITLGVVIGHEQPQPLPLLNLSHISDFHEPGEQNLGGGTTIRDTTFKSFGRVAANFYLFDNRWPYFREGRKLFEREWNKREQGDILGPLYNNVSCNGCHGKDGRGQPPARPDDIPEQMVFRLSVENEHGDALPEPAYGEQLSYFGNDKAPAEGNVRVSYTSVHGTFADGTPYTLQKPRYDFTNLAHGTLASDARFSPRVAPVNFGLGLLEAIPDRAILRLADPDDRNNDGISGRPNYAVEERSGRLRMGRFGWKAGQPTVEQQIAKALSADMGISTSLFPDQGTPVQRAGALPGDPEMSDEQFDELLFYMKTLAVPARRNWESPQVQRGKSIFRALGCASCHHPLFVTGSEKRFPELTNQTIRPYTDLLLHDMGEGLADDRSEGVANGREWRTPPLWGIGLVRNVNKHTRFLHDGRARNIEEAVLWHGGEAEASQRYYLRLNKADRGALLEFLESL